MQPNFNQLRVVTFESRLSKEITGLFERLGARVHTAPALQELPAPESPQALRFADELLAGRIDMVIFLTGVGARTLMSLIEQKHPPQRIIDALAKTTTIARGPKPVAAMREWRLQPTLVAPEPNTWQEVIAVIDQQDSIQGKRVAVQEYGVPNQRLYDALRERGAEVLAVPVYSWGLPEDVTPLEEAIKAIIAGQVEVVAFTSAQQVHHVLQQAGKLGVEKELRQALRGTVIGSIGPTCSETLRDVQLGVDFEPDGVKMGDLVRGLARSANLLLGRKRASRDAGVDTAHYRRIDVQWPADATVSPGDPLTDSVFMKACRREAVPYTPIWLMRQAGRYQREYREIRSKVSFLEMCKRPELAAEVTLMAVDRLTVDAAIIFADILLIVESMGVGLAFNKGEGPSITRPVRSGRDVDALQEVDPEALSYVYDAVRLTRRALKPDIPLIGFCGAPFTVASYMIEGGGSRNFIECKSLMYRDPGAWHALMEKITTASARYLNGQIAAGAQVVQLFDSWVGCLNEEDYRQFVLPHSKRLIEAVTPGTPVIHFGADTAVLLRAMRAAGGEVIGFDWRVRMDQAWEWVGHDVAVQGNLDPVTLFATPSEIERRAKIILDQVAGRSGHIFNLGHGILPGTSIDHALALIDFVHMYSQR